MNADAPMILTTEQIDEINYLQLEPEDLDLMDSTRNDTYHVANSDTLITYKNVYMHSREDIARFIRRQKFTIVNGDRSPAPRIYWVSDLSLAVWEMMFLSVESVPFSDPRPAEYMEDMIFQIPRDEFLRKAFFSTEDISRMTLKSTSPGITITDFNHFRFLRDEWNRTNFATLGHSLTWSTISGNRTQDTKAKLWIFLYLNGNKFFNL